MPREACPRSVSGIQATTKGLAFLAVEDPGGMVDVVIAPDIYTRDRAAVQGAFVLIKGGITEGLT